MDRMKRIEIERIQLLRAWTMPMVTAFVLLFGQLSGVAQDSGVGSSDKPTMLDQTPSNHSVMDQLFQDLRSADNEAAAQRILSQIDANWRATHGETAALLLGRADEAISEEQWALAHDILDQLIALEPDYAEAWNRRATLYYMRDDYGAALSDIAVVLELEPRHFRAMTGLALLLEQIGEAEQAYEVLSRALFLNPFQDHIREQMKSLEALVLGQES